MSLVRLRPEAPYASVAHLVERHLAKVEVASSSLVTRSIFSIAMLFVSGNAGIYGSQIVGAGSGCHRVFRPDFKNQFYVWQRLNILSV